ncbi:MAG: periplasmic heavy metal sensor [Mangrovicoccus sp.]|nr:periplasmic heavy metal sensor [Mangrovicoccus sp.]
MAEPDTDMPEPPRAQRPKSRLFWRVLVALSLALNVLVLGAALGLFLSGGPERGERPGAELRAAGRLPTAMMLPQDARQDLRARLRDGPADFAQSRGEERDLLRQIDRVLRADPLDRDALTGLFETRRALRQTRAEAVDQALIETLAAMPQAQREAFADRMAKRKLRKEGRGHDRKYPEHKHRDGDKQRAPYD